MASSRAAVHRCKRIGRVKWGRTVDDNDSTAMTATAQHGDGGMARRWQHSMTMAAQQEVMAMQETELQGVMPAKIADAVLVVVS